MTDDSNFESVGSVSAIEKEALLRSPRDTTGVGSMLKIIEKFSNEELKANAFYKAAVKVQERFSCTFKLDR